jgi:SOS-response transcriptional repressor LexA
VRGLTVAQAEMFAYFYGFASTRGRWPTIREAMDSLGMSSTNGPRSVYRALQSKGYMDIIDGKWVLTGYRFKLVLDNEPAAR